MSLPFNDGDSALKAAEKFVAHYQLGKDNLGVIL